MDSIKVWPMPSAYWKRINYEGENIQKVYRSCIALFYRKRLPQQQGDRRMRERDTSMH
jgi:hypothetical protein